MTPAVLDRPASLFADSRAAAAGASAPPPAHGRLTLEALLTSALHATRTSGSAECPVCHARMTLTRAHAECGGCGSRLS